MDDAAGAGVRRPSKARRFAPSSGAWILAVGLVAAVVIVVVAAVTLAPLSEARRHVKQVVEQDLSLQQSNAHLRSVLAEWQLFIEPQFDAGGVSGTTVNALDVATGTQLVQAQLDEAKSLSAGLRRRGMTGEARALDAAMAPYSEAVTNLGQATLGTALPSAELAMLIARERTTIAVVWKLTTEIDQTVAQDVTAPDVRQVEQTLSVAHTGGIIAGGLIALVILVAAIVLARRTARRDHTKSRDANRMRYSAELQEALELVTSENAAYLIVGRALREATPQLDVELLVADSSRAHFRRVIDSHDDGHQLDGCGVVAPRDCPATVRAHTMLFPSSEMINACPYLRDRPSGALSAVCVPVSIAGRTIGVMHARGPDRMLPPKDDVEKLDLTARRAAERFALLRSFEKSETQAHTDPLTGLLNRRSLENRVRELQTDGIPYAVAYGDLDHFKMLNDTGGHEAGDQALRVFSRVLPRLGTARRSRVPLRR